METPNLEPQIAHILSIDVVGYSTLLVDQQIDLLKQLNKIVRETSCSRTAEAKGTLIRLPTGDGMVLLFFHSPEEPVQCALEISQKLRDHPQIRVRMGAHSGPVNRVEDVNEQPNVAGDGINAVQRILDSGDAGHILLSKRLADDLGVYGHWQPYLHDLGKHVVKHGLTVHLYNFQKGQVGNPKRPQKLVEGDRVIARTRRGPTSYLVATALILVAAALAMFLLARLRQKPTPPDKSIAVLPFGNLSDNATNAYFADGVQDDILTDLSKFSQLKVIGRTSVLKYRDLGNLTVEKVAASLGVRYLLQGNVRREGNRVRVTATLIDSKNGSQTWADRFDRDLADVFAIQSEIAQQIVARLEVQFTPEERAEIEDRPTNDLIAYDLYVRAKAIIAQVLYDSSDTHELLEAAQLLDEAVARDPSFFLAYCQLASANDRIYFHGIDRTEQRLARAQAAVDATVRLRPDFGETHLALGAHYYFGYLDYERARQELAIAVRKLPNDPLPTALLGYIDRREGRWPSAIMRLEHVTTLDPRNLVFLKQLALTYSCVRNYAETRSVLGRSIAFAPEDPVLAVRRAGVDLDSDAVTAPLHEAIEAALTKNPDVGRLLADQWLLLALCERDSVGAGRALAVMTEDGCHEEGIPYPKAWCEGLFARQRQDIAAAKVAFNKARKEVARIVQEQPDNAEALSGLGMIDAALADKDNALREGARAVELLPINKDAVVGPLLLQNLAVIHAWTGDPGKSPG